MTIKEKISQMTLEEKASMCSGKDFWHTQNIDRLSIPSIMVSDGPHGLRKQDKESDHAGINESIKAVCFPTGSAAGSSFDVDLIRSLGEALGDECMAEDVSILLGPAVNIKRSPLCGRNFEYFSEDPYLTATIATSYVKGVQSKNIGTSLKHYLANNQEHRRMSSSSEVDERTLREIYLPGFEGVVKDARPWSIMCSYNKVNGVYASESQRYLTDILRDEWGFEGFVVSDWGAVSDRVKGVKAGLELEMPSSNGLNDKKIVDAVKSGDLDEKVLDRSVEKILTIVDKYTKNRVENTVWDLEAHHQLSRKISSECMVLLKNEEILPLNKEASIAFIGEFAKKPRYQGGGSSHINSFKTIGAVDAAETMTHINYAQGYKTNEDIVDDSLIAEAVEVAKGAEIAVVFAGLPDSFESEGYDRSHMSLPKSQNYLIEKILEVQPNTVVVLHNGSPVEMPWVNKVKAILEVYLGGQAVGEATVDVLFGDVNPSGKLAETFPLKLKDNPSYLYYLGEKDIVEYREGVFVGYRYYDKKDMDVLFPFGHGLSYTTFEYSNIKLSSQDLIDGEDVEVFVDVTNTGLVEGKEVVQLYVAPIHTDIIRPERELKAFTKVQLAPSETKTVSFKLSKRSFAYYNTEISDWYVEQGEYLIEIGKSSRNIELSDTINYINDQVIPQVFTLNSTFGDIMINPKASELIKPLMKNMNELFGDSDSDNVENEAITKDMLEAMLKYMPLRGIVSFGNGSVTEEELIEIVTKINHL